MTPLATLLAVVVVVGALAGRAIFRRDMQAWLPAYLVQALRPRPVARGGTLDVLFCFVDHFEPGWNQADYATECSRVDGWVRGYPAVARDFVDADGRHPQHTWFYPPHYYRPEHLDKLVRLCQDGCGEIEMHLHHSRTEPFPDTSATLKEKIRSCIETYGRFGIFDTLIDGTRARRYAFIHGNWALDGTDPRYCGVTDELIVLRDTGCYADFTFPAYMNASQPAVPNSIYYATDDPVRPGSHRRGSRVRAGGQARGDLLIVQGPLGLRWTKRFGILLPKVDDGEIAGDNPPSPERVDFWVRTGIHVEGRPEWIIVKVFTHGADRREQGVLLGDPIRRMHAYLGEAYNDGTRYRLHYVTARELYNVIKAAEAGLTGNPGAYRDYVIKPYAYRTEEERIQGTDEPQRGANAGPAR
jgi:hypothetical protein